jgi:hypothetical protein
MSFKTSSDQEHERAEHERRQSAVLSSPDVPRAGPGVLTDS